MLGGGLQLALIPAPLIAAVMVVFALAPGQARAARITAGIGIAATISLLAPSSTGAGASRRRSARRSPGSPTFSASICPAQRSVWSRRRPVSSCCSRAIVKPVR